MAVHPPGSLATTIFSDRMRAQGPRAQNLLEEEPYIPLPVGGTAPLPPPPPPPVVSRMYLTSNPCAVAAVATRVFLPVLVRQLG